MERRIRDLAVRRESIEESQTSSGKSRRERESEVLPP
jgi:hypothetical protein